MEDWRINGQEAYLNNAVFYKITFPIFWEKAYKDQNKFYQKILSYAEYYVKSTGTCREYLEGDQIQHLWHDHCEFCWEKAVTNEPLEFYCTTDLKYWVCKNCFQDFANRFQWQVIPFE